MSKTYDIYKILPGRLLKRLIIRWLFRKSADSQLLREIYRNDYGIIIGYGTYGGCFNTSNIPSGTTFGNYCSIADGVKIFRANHPLSLFTSHPIFYNPVMGYVKTDKLERPPLSIGHDVWIGANAIILPSCHNIGNGAVIGAGSVVTKNVEPYSIVAGNPAKIIKMRFNDSQIQYIESTRWWERSMDDLVKLKDEIQKNLSK